MRMILKNFYSPQRCFFIRELTNAGLFCSSFCIKRMLDEMENDLDKTTQRLDFVTQKTKEMIKRSGGKQNFLVIVALIVVAFILILLILYT